MCQHTFFCRWQFSWVDLEIDFYYSSCHRPAHVFRNLLNSSKHYRYYIGLKKKKKITKREARESIMINLVTKRFSRLKRAALFEALYYPIHCMTK